MPEKNYDVIVVGSGAAGLTTAITTARSGLSTLVLEAAAEFGGTSAVSGGRVWVPNNGTPENEGDTPEAAKEYLRRVYGEDREDFICAYVDNAPRMRDFIQANSPHRFKVCPNYPDYHLNYAGATVGGRCLDMEILWRDSVRPESRQVREAPSYSPITHAEWEKWRYPQFTDAKKLAERYDEGGRTAGNALVTALLEGAHAAGAETRLSSPVTEILTTDGAVVGVKVGPDEEIHANTVVLAAGGFDANSQLWDEFLPQGLGATAAVNENTGLGIATSRNLNLPLENMDEGWWMPMTFVPGETLDGRTYPRGLVRERGVPRSVIVNQAGQRFINEASPYNEFGKHMHLTDASGQTPNKVAYLIFDEGFRTRYPFPGLSPEGPLPEHVISANTLEELAHLIDVDPAALAQTVSSWNSYCADGKDLAFHRGENAYDQYYGDPWQDGNRSLGPIDSAPYYATRIYSGSVGTKGGLVTSVTGAVQSDTGDVPGLYAVGNSAAWWTHGGYPGPGATLGLGMVFGILAGESIAQTALT